MFSAETPKQIKQVNWGGITDKATVTCPLICNTPDFDSHIIFHEMGEYFPHFKLLSLVQNDH